MLDISQNPEFRHQNQSLESESSACASHHSDPLTANTVDRGLPADAKQNEMKERKPRTEEMKGAQISSQR